MRNAVMLLAILASCSRDAAQDVSGSVRNFVTIVREAPAGDLAPAFQRTAAAFGLQPSTPMQARGVYGGYRVELFHRKSTMPDGPRQWITLKLHGPTKPIDDALLAALGKPNGRGFGDEDGWLLPNGGLILERWDGQRDITFSPGPPQDALEDLARPHIPSLAAVEQRLRSSGWRLQEIGSGSAQRRALAPPDHPAPEILFISADEPARLIGLRIDSSPVANPTWYESLAAAGVEDVREGVDNALQKQRASPRSVGCAAHGNYFITAQRLRDGGLVRVDVWRRPLAMWNVSIQETCAPV